MDGIMMSLLAAKEQRLLINLYQKDVEDFYTGYVQAVAGDGVVLNTYIDAGLADGAAYVTLGAIDSIEVAGADLNTMQYRIAKSSDKSFSAMPAAPLRLPLNADNPLLYQVAENMRRTGQAVVVVSLDAENYLEGQIVEVSDSALVLKVFNKFNYSDHRQLTVDFSSLTVLEFEGYDLMLESVLLSQRGQLQHESTSRYRNNGQLGKIFKIVRDAEQLVAVITRMNNDNFYVGRVRAVSNEFVVMAMLDMSGQFGGYAIIRLRNINFVLTDSDYVQTVAFYEGWAKKQHFAQAPGLNRAREFNDDADFLADIVAEAEIMGKVLRVRSAEQGEPVNGSISATTDKGFTLKPFGQPEAEEISFRYEQVLDLTFDSVYAFLQEEWLRDSE